MAFTQEQLDAIDLAIVENAGRGGPISVSWGSGQTSRSVTYRSYDELLKIRGIVARALGQARRWRRVKTRKGFRNADE